MADVDNDIENIEAARRARSEKNFEDAKKYYGLVSIDDPDCAEARFYYNYYNLLTGSRKEVYENFYEVCKVVGPVLKSVSEGSDRGEKERLITEIFNDIRELPVTVNSQLNKLNDRSKENEYAEKIKDSIRIGIQTFYNFGDVIEKYLYPDLKLMRIGIRAWEAGVYRQEQFYGVGLDVEFIERYKYKIRKYSYVCKLCEDAGLDDLPDKDKIVYEEEERVSSEPAGTAPANFGPADESGYSWYNGNYSSGNGEYGSDEYNDGYIYDYNSGGNESDYRSWNGDSFGVSDESDPFYRSWDRNNFDSDYEDNYGNGGYDNGYYDNNGGYGYNDGYSDDRFGNYDGGSYGSSDDRFGGYGNDSYDDRFGGFDNRGYNDGYNNGYDGNYANGYDNRYDDYNDNYNGGYGNGYGGNNAPRGGFYVQEDEADDMISWDEWQEGERPTWNNEIAQMVNKLSLACPICQRKLLDNCGNCAGITLKCPSCKSSVKMDIDAKGCLRLIVKPKEEEENNYNDYNNGYDDYNNNRW